MELAYALGKTLRELGEMDIEELALWFAWLSEHTPIPEKRADWRAASLMSAIVNCRMAWQGDTDAEDFMPDRQPVSDAEAEKKILAWAAMVGRVGRPEGAMTDEL